jgi:hypothetical protein
MTYAISQLYLGGGGGRGKGKTYCNFCNSKCFFDSYILHTFLKAYSKLSYSIRFQNIAVTENNNIFCNFVCLYTEIARETLVLYELLIRSKMHVAQCRASEHIASNRNDSKFAQGT